MSLSGLHVGVVSDSLFLTPTAVCFLVFPGEVTHVPRVHSLFFGRRLSELRGVVVPVFFLVIVTFRSRILGQR